MAARWTGHHNRDAQRTSRIARAALRGSRFARAARWAGRFAGAAQAGHLAGACGEREKVAHSLHMVRVQKIKC